jgi:hypothetical protein
MLLAPPASKSSLFINNGVASCRWRRLRSRVCQSGWHAKTSMQQKASQVSAHHKNFMQSGIKIRCVIVAVAAVLQGNPGNFVSAVVLPSAYSVEAGDADRSIDEPACALVFQTRRGWMQLD